MAEPAARPGTLEVRGLSVRFGGLTALRDVSLSVASREIVGVIGPNGAGKTTLFNAVCRFVQPVSGTITYAGHSLLSLRASRLASLGIVRTLQGLGLWQRLSVLQNVVAGAPTGTHLVADLLALPRADRRARALERRALQVLDDVGIAGAAHASPGELPHGMQKRVVIARALMAEPSLLLLDEPASGLSAAEVDALASLLRGLRSRMGIALVEHHLDLVMAVSDRVTVLDLGAVIASGEPAQIRTDPRVATAYLGQEVVHARG